MSATATSRALAVRPIDQPLESRGNQAITPTVSEESIALRLQELAYTLWEQRGRPDGSPEIDWQEAERLMQSSSANSAAVA